MTNPFTCRLCGMTAGTVRTGGGKYELAHDGTLQAVITTALAFDAPVVHVPERAA